MTYFKIGIYASKVFWVVFGEKHNRNKISLWTQISIYFSKMFKGQQSYQLVKLSHAFKAFSVAFNQ